MKYSIDGVKFVAVVTVGQEKKTDVNFEVGKIEAECSSSEFIEVMKTMTEAMKTMAELSRPRITATYDGAGKKIA